MRILVVEDEEALADAIQYVLEKEGYLVDVVYNGEDGESYALSNIYDALVLDRMLPGMSGTQILNSVRKHGNDVPAMFLTAMDTVDDRVEGLETGADDYLIKPFANKELVARVKALLRRREVKLISSKRYLGEGVLDVNKNEFVHGKELVQLSKTECQLLEYFAMNESQVLSKEQILDKVWGFDQDVSEANVELYVFYLRKKIDFQKMGYELKTVRGRGYMLSKKAALQ